MSSDKTLILTVGLPFSGKTTWAMVQGVPVVSPDAIRSSLHGRPFYADAEPIVWATAKLMVRSLFRAGHGIVILDACSVSPVRRKEWLDDEWRLRYRVVLTPHRVCEQRIHEFFQGADPALEMISVLERMVAQWDIQDIDDNDLCQQVGAGKWVVPA